MIDFNLSFPLSVQNGGVFISRGVGIHPERTLTSWEVIFVEKGTLTIQEDHKVFEVSEGESLVLYPHRRHRGVGVFPPDLKFYWVHFDVHDVPASVGLPQAKISLPQHSKVPDPEQVITLFRQFLAEQENITRSCALELLLLLILQKISLTAPARDAQTRSGIALAWRAQQCIRTQYHQAISTSSLAQNLHCSADYLGRVYRRVFHLTITDAIHRQRVVAAQKLLLSDSLALVEVATRCGFQDVGYFRQIFRKQTGLTPAAWQRRYCKEHINSD
ncbi:MULTISPECIES: AraC family transcriptional regulator [Mangrovibacter]|uniref:Arabinose operon regulatory protein n=1 Tax=Mangrovibacter plantisponsor TaxID=451513 RepID=A0A317PXI5_9ENTR|nr:MULTISPECIES: AraC family transcriptional regulator [Mangrovibacter]KEA53048.1 transcriptional regulator [Mangrovibacter sp. MFB070]PWW06651.1 AraC-like protein [Mangrovibacter plantisponsor]